MQDEPRNRSFAIFALKAAWIVFVAMARFS
jgi:hypothetical protein